MSRTRRQTKEQKQEWMRERQHRKGSDSIVVMEPRESVALATLPNEKHLIDTFDEKQWRFQEAADHLAISKGTLKRLAMKELAKGASGIGNVRIGPKKKQTLWTFADSALRRIHNRMTGGFYNQPD